jgi:dihydrofolate reductase
LYDRSGGPFTDHVNAITKYVVSTTLTDPHWANTSVIDRDPVAAVRELKGQDGGKIVQYGFGPIAHSLLAAGLIDELRLRVHPFFVGTGSAADVIYRPARAARAARAARSARRPCCTRFPRVLYDTKASLPII